MSWDLFSAAAAAERDAAALGARRGARAEPDGAANEALARAVAAGDFEMPALGRLPSRHEGWSVATVNAVARELIEGALPPLWVVGEVANFTRARSGHCYFTLRDDSAQLRCVMWRDEARRLPTAPKEGMQLRALGRLTIYEGRGEFQLVVSEL
jgi:exodeoxyribonuclease VII large subunit